MCSDTPTGLVIADPYPRRGVSRTNWLPRPATTIASHTRLIASIEAASLAGTKSTNLRWLRSCRTRAVAYGGMGNRRVYTEEKLRDLHERAGRGESLTEIAAAMGIGYQTVRKVAQEEGLKVVPGRARVALPPEPASRRFGGTWQENPVARSPGLFR
jgi:hypothetical protein